MTKKMTNGDEEADTVLSIFMNFLGGRDCACLGSISIVTPLLDLYKNTFWATKWWLLLAAFQFTETLIVALVKSHRKCLNFVVWVCLFAFKY